MWVVRLYGKLSRNCFKAHSSFADILRRSTVACRRWRWELITSRLTFQLWDPKKVMFPARLSPCIKSAPWKHPQADQYQLARRGEEEMLLVVKNQKAQILPPLYRRFSGLELLFKQLICNPGWMRMWFVINHMEKNPKL